MQDRQFEESLPSSKEQTPSVLPLWFIPTHAPLQAITAKEEQWANQLPKNRGRQYHHSRGYVRAALSKLWELPALEIPLYSPPGKAPELSKGWGNISFSHCNDALLIGWSPNSIGVDLERLDRPIRAKQIMQRFFSEEENNVLNALNEHELRLEVIKKWVIKEAAIKWQRGNIAGNISQWQADTTSTLIINKAMNLTTNLYTINHFSWQIAIAYDARFHRPPIIICQID